MSPGLVLAVLLGEAGLCGPLPEAAPPDPEAAALYREVAEAEQSAGRPETARAAWREVLRYAPHEARAREALEALCAAEPEEDAQVVALRAGLAHLERGEEEAAAAAFRVALAAPELEDTAAWFLGLLALREGRGREAMGYFARAEDSPDRGLARRAEALRLRAAREGRLSLRVRVGSEYDSNVDLIPDGTRRLVGNADGVGTGLAELRLRPWGGEGPYLRASGHHRGHLRWRGFDLAGVGGALGWAHAGRVGRLSAEYGFDGLVLGGQPYLLAHRGQVDALLALGPVGLSASGAVRREDFSGELYVGYSGWTGQATLEAEWSPVEALSLRAGWRGGLLQAREVALGFVEQGPRAGWLLRLGARLRLGGEVGHTARGYRAFDDLLGVRRRDDYLEAGAVGEWDVAAHWSLQATVGWRGAASNVEELTHGRLVGGLGLVWAGGLP